MKSIRLAALPLLACIASPAVAGEAAIESVVITASPLRGANIDPDKIAISVQGVTDADVTRFGAPDVLKTLQNEVAGVSLANAQANPLQPNLFYRGFEASPLAGNAQGLAVYANGVRLNQPFGDTLNWDLIPDVAIDRLSIEGSNPVFGLNALGGAIAIAMKDGFGFNGVEAEGSAGSFGRGQFAGQFGAAENGRSFYAAVQGVTDHGWREHSPSRLAQAFTDLGWRAGDVEIHLDLTGATSDLTGNGSAPVELLAARRSAVFTYPDRTLNTYGLANVRGVARLTDVLAIQGNAYISHLHQRTRNGDASEVASCTAAPGLVCFDDGSVVTGVGGNPVPDFLAGGTYAQLNRTATETTGYGAALQTSYDAALLARGNRLIAGVAVDAGHTVFAADTALGTLAADRGFVGPGTIIQQPNGSIAPLRVSGNNIYYGLYVSDVLDVTDALSLTISARYNIASINLEDRLGAALNGSHHYVRLNPAAGAAYKISPSLTAYAGYSESNRAPTPAEFSCADPAAPCSLTNFFTGDPNLKQVVARTGEAGLRGRALLSEATALTWYAGVYRTDARDDIQFVASPVLGRAFFENVGGTRRQGFESSLGVQSETWSLSFDYSFTEATYRDALVFSSPENPFADANGQIAVRPGNRFPSIPAHLFKATLAYEPAPDWSVNLAVRAAGGVYLQGDAANLNAKTGSYAVFDVGGAYQVSETIQLFASVENVFDADYATFGTFSPVSAVPMAEAPGATNPRSLAPAPPRTFGGGLRVRF